MWESKSQVSKSEERDIDNTRNNQHYLLNNGTGAAASQSGQDQVLQNACLMHALTYLAIFGFGYNVIYESTVVWVGLDLLVLFRLLLFSSSSYDEQILLASLSLSFIRMKCYILLEKDSVFLFCSLTKWVCDRYYPWTSPFGVAFFRIILFFSFDLRPSEHAYTLEILLFRWVSHLISSSVYSERTFVHR